MRLLAGRDPREVAAALSSTLAASDSSAASPGGQLGHEPLILSTGCTRHGPNCNHPACHAISAIAQRAGLGGSGGATPASLLGEVPMGAQAVLQAADQAVRAALTSGSRCQQRHMRRRFDPAATDVSLPDHQLHCQDCDHPCGRLHDFDLVLVEHTSSGVPWFRDRRMAEAEFPVVGLRRVRILGGRTGEMGGGERTLALPHGLVLATTWPVLWTLTLPQAWQPYGQFPTACCRASLVTAVIR
jgi:hypothetical protein